KNFFRDAARGVICESGNPLVKLISKKPVYPGEEEKLLNPSSRSARLRVVEKI
ncbi:MAG: 16S rRNA (cytosine(1402)-N(4))-methyltransferase, partial [Candidatus Eremiobacterota bacterium]